MTPAENFPPQCRVCALRRMMCTYQFEPCDALSRKVRDPATALGAREPSHTDLTFRRARSAAD
jgi:hypothetical protein